MVLVDIPCQTLGRDSCKEHRSFGPVRSGRRVPNPPADRSVCESSAARILIKRPPPLFLAPPCTRQPSGGGRKRGGSTGDSDPGR